MNMFSMAWEKIKEMISKMVKPGTLEQKLHITPSISNNMANAIELWADMYEDKAPWLNEPNAADLTAVRSMGLPAFIASEKARMATLEMKVEISAPVKEVEVENPEYVKQQEQSDLQPLFTNVPETIKQQVPITSTDRADYLAEQFKKLQKKIRTQLEYGIAKGGLVIMPYVVQGTTNAETGETSQAQIEFDFVQADGFYPLAFDASGRVTEAAFVQRKLDKDAVYTRLAHHLFENGTITVVNKCYKSANKDLNSGMMDNDLGNEVPLTSVPEWASLEPSATITNVDRLLFGYFKMPEANTVDPYSPLGVSAYSRVVPLIREADKQYSRMLWEFEAGEMAIDVDRDALMIRKDQYGNDTTVLPHNQQRLFRKIDNNDETFYNVFAPQLREQSIINGLNNILMRIEDEVGFSRGTLSDVAAEARTATELKILRQRSYCSNSDIQQALEDTLEDVIYVMNVYCDLYEITPDGEYQVGYEWDDSIITDVDTELTKRITLMNAGLSSKVETRMWYFGETEDQAIEALSRIDQEHANTVASELASQQDDFFEVLISKPKAEEEE